MDYGLFTGKRFKTSSIDSIHNKTYRNHTSRMLSTTCTINEDGETASRDSSFKRKLDAEIKKGIDAAVTALADKHILPHAATMIENITLQETNKWGEKTGQNMTFVEYLVQRAEAYMTEGVNYEGKSKDEARGYSWTGTQTRITHMVHEHLHYSIETAMKQSLKDANSSICKGIEEAVKIKLAEALQGLKTTVQTK